MIEKMRKYSFLVYHNDYDTFVEKLYELGVIDIIEKEKVSVINEKLEDKLSLMKQYASAEKHLENILKTPADSVPFTPSCDMLIDDYKLLRDKKDTIKQQQLQVKKDIESLTPWGDFDLSTIDKITEAGYYFNFFTCTKKHFNEEWKEKYNAIIVYESNTNYCFVTVTKENDVTIEADKVKLPERSLNELTAQYAALNEEGDKISAQLTFFAQNHLPKLKAEYDALRTEFDFSKVKLNTESVADEKVKLIEGWGPESKDEALESYLHENGVLYTSREPDTSKDNIPILLKNNRFNKLFEPLGELYTLPAYGEIDLTPFFAPFYMLFFGLCLGDAGYGLIMAVAAFILAAKAKPSMKGIFRLAGWLGVATVIMGFISGTFFGVSLIDANIPWLEKFKKYMMDSDKLFTNSLILGAIQIVFGMFIKIFNEFKQKRYSGGIVTIGWLLIILGCGGTFALSHFNVIDQSTAKIMYYVFGISGGICVFLLNNLNFNKKNLFGILNIGSGLWNTYNMATGILGDVLSYIRLFALGISGSVMGFVFNSLAMDLSPDIPVLKQVVMLIILLIGHGMNIFMSALSAFVHPMRLTFVEFYKNSGFTGGGKKYKPFGKVAEQQ